MKNEQIPQKFDRRTVLKAAAAVGVAQIASPFVVPTWAADNIKMGMVDPLTGVYAAPAGNEVMGAKLPSNKSTPKAESWAASRACWSKTSANDVGTGVQKARKLIERDNVNFIIGDVNSGIAAAIAELAEKKVLHVVSGGHTNSITGKDCHWNVYRCNTDLTRRLVAIGMPSLLQLPKCLESRQWEGAAFSKCCIDIERRCGI